MKHTSTHILRCLFLSFTVLIHSLHATAAENIDDTRSCSSFSCAMSGAAGLCSLNLTSDLCVGNNAQVGGNLSVCGKITAGGIRGANYLDLEDVRSVPGC